MVKFLSYSAFAIVTTSDALNASSDTRLRFSRLCGVLRGNNLSAKKIVACRGCRAPVKAAFFFASEGVIIIS